MYLVDCFHYNLLYALLFLLFQVNYGASMLTLLILLLTLQGILHT